MQITTPLDYNELRTISPKAARQATPQPNGVACKSPPTQTAKSARFRLNQCPQGYNRVKLVLFYSALISPLSFDGGNIHHPAAV